MQNDYRRKSDAELRFIIQDAGEAALAMRGVSVQAEGKYLDQVNDATTELHKRAPRINIRSTRRNVVQMLADVSDHKLQTLNHDQLRNLIKDLRQEARATL